jgi:ankyrin repeat protein
LIEKGANINAQNGQPLIDAIFRCMNVSNYIFQSINIDIIKLLIYKGADVNAQNGKPLIDALNYKAWDKNKECIKLLIEKGANINAQNGQPLINAIYICMNFKLSIYEYKSTNIDLIKLLIYNGADVNAQNGQPLIDALKYKAWDQNEECIKLLIEKGANLNAQNGLPMLYIVKSENIQLITYFIGLGVKINSKYLLDVHDNEILLLLICQGANVSINNDYLLTNVLMMNSKNSEYNYERLKILLNNGAKLNNKSLILAYNILKIYEKHKNKKNHDCAKCEMAGILIRNGFNTSYIKQKIYENMHDLIKYEKFDINKL